MMTPKFVGVVVGGAFAGLVALTVLGSSFYTGTGFEFQTSNHRFCERN